MKKEYLLGFIYFTLHLNFTLVHSHGRLMDPPNRSSMWRFPEFSEYNLTQNFQDNELFCGGFQIQYEVNGGQCGLCGDPFNQTVPRDNEDGGIYGQGVIAKTYKAGQIFTVDVELTSPHWGYWELRLCPWEPVTQQCFDEHLLRFPGGEEMTKFYVRQKEEDDHEPRYYSVAVKLPKKLSSPKAVIQWTYTTGTRWGQCEDGRHGRGCGPQEIFRNCADIAIL